MRSFTPTASAALAAIFPLASAGIVQFCPNQVCYSVAVPESSASSGSGNLYFQLSAPTSYQWVALGQGSRMAGANIFIMYTDGNGNVTISPRAGRGHFMPQVDESVQLTLLEGSGVSDGVMTANVRCSNCQSWSGGTMNFDSSSTNWIGSWRSGDAINSASIGEGLTQHDDTTQFRIDLTAATVSTDGETNPFTSAAGGGSSGGGSGTGSGSGNGGDDKGGERPDGDSDDGDDDGRGGGSGGSSSGGNGGVTVETESSLDSTLLAHGILMAVVWVIMYPVGALLMPLLGSWLIHAGWQFVAFVAMWAGFGLGVVLAQDYGILFKQTHTLLGTVVVCLMVIQPALGFAHHSYYKKHQARGLISHAHIWYGRIVMLLGIINGGLGLQLARAPRAFIIAYAVIAAVVSVLYALAGALGARRRRSPRRTKEEMTESPREPAHPA